MLHLFRQPFPFSRGLKYELAHICIVGICVLIIFYFLHPFQPAKHDDLLLLGFALVSMLSASIFTIISHFFYDFLRNRTWTIGYEMIRSLIYLLFIGAGIIIYSNVLGIAAINLPNFLLYEFYTLMLGIVPVFIRIILIRNWRLKKDLGDALKMALYLNKRNINLDEKIIKLASPLPARALEISNHSLLYVEAAQNYITAVWCFDKMIKKEQLRLTMKEAHRQMNDPFIIFCHRSYMVNLRKVKKMTSHTGNWRLHLQDSDIIIPISNTYKKEVKQKLLTS
jgi:hypothetical protein